MILAERSSLRNEGRFFIPICKEFERIDKFFLKKIKKCFAETKKNYIFALTKFFE